MEFTDIKLRPERDKRRQKVDFNFDHLDNSSSFYFYFYLKYEILFLIEAETIIIMKKVHLFIKTQRVSPLTRSYSVHCPVTGLVQLGLLNYN